MIVLCDKCGRRYDDTFRWTFCPHDTLAANDGQNNFAHHPESFIEPEREIPVMLIDPIFQVHRLNEDGLKKAEEIAAAFNDCLFRISGMCPAGRELAIVKTKLEEASFFAKKSMANDPANQA